MQFDIDCLEIVYHIIINRFFLPDLKHLGCKTLAKSFVLLLTNVLYSISDSFQLSQFQNPKAHGEYGYFEAWYVIVSKSLNKSKVSYQQEMSKNNKWSSNFAFNTPKRKQPCEITVFLYITKHQSFGFLLW